MKLKNYCAIAAVAAFTTAAASAAAINLNFQGTAPAMGAADVAGAPGVADSNWNNVTGAGGTYGTTTVAISGGGLGTGGWTLPATSPIGTGDGMMYHGFFETDGTAATISVSGLSYALYDVYVYFDGDNAAQWRTANYSIGATSFNGVEDSENTNWGTGQNVNMVYQLPTATGTGNSNWPVTGPNNNEGNYVKFSGVTGSSFDLIMKGAASQGTVRGVINGMQIVQIPEPSSTALLGLGGLALVLRRRRK